MGKNSKGKYWNKNKKVGQRRKRWINFERGVRAKKKQKREKIQTGK